MRRFEGFGGVAEHERVQPDPGHDHERAVPEDADVEAAAVAGGQEGQCVPRPGRHTEVGGEQVAGAEWQDRQCGVGAGEVFYAGPYGPVTASGDDDVDTGGDRFPGLSSARIAPGGLEPQRRWPAVVGEDLGDQGADGVRLGHLAGVGDDRGPDADRRDGLGGRCGCRVGVAGHAGISRRGRAGAASGGRARRGGARSRTTTRVSQAPPAAAPASTSVGKCMPR